MDKIEYEIGILESNAMTWRHEKVFASNLIEAVNLVASQCRDVNKIINIDSQIVGKEVY